MVICELSAAKDGLKVGSIVGVNEGLGDGL